MLVVWAHRSHLCHPGLPLSYIEPCENMLPLASHKDRQQQRLRPLRSNRTKKHVKQRKGFPGSSRKAGKVVHDRQNGRKDTPFASTACSAAISSPYRTFPFRCSSEAHTLRPFKTGCWTVSYPVHTGSDASREKKDRPSQHPFLNGLLSQLISWSLKPT